VNSIAFIQMFISLIFLRVLVTSAKQTIKSVHASNGISYTVEEMICSWCVAC